MLKWISMATPPETSGNYIVGHRGHQIITYYMISSNAIKLGWRDDPRNFGATHWAEFEPPEYQTESIIDTTREFLHPVPEKTIVTFNLTVTNAPFVIGEYRNRYAGKHFWSRGTIKFRHRTEHGKIEKGMTGTVVKSLYNGKGRDGLQFDIELHDGVGSVVTFREQNGFPFTCKEFWGI